MTAYYNEIDPFAAAWLRELISFGHIAPGIVDERSIEDVKPQELRQYTQVHLFAGIGVWSYALRQAGWPDDRPVWTGSCPCQPFSAAGKGAGFDDERHLWPAFHWLIEQCKPSAIFGEQVASKSTGPWFDLVQADLEGMGYAFGCVPFPSAGVGAPHIRDRAYWVGNATDVRGKVFNVGAVGRQERQVNSEAREGNGQADRAPGAASGMGHPGALGRQQQQDGAGGNGERVVKAGREQVKPGETGGDFSGMGDASSESVWRDAGASIKKERECKLWPGGDTNKPPGATCRPGPTNGIWRNVDWLGCQDNKWRPVEPGTFPLVDGAPARVGRLRGYGNAINAEQAKIFIESITL